MTEHHLDLHGLWIEGGGKNVLGGYKNFTELFNSLPKKEAALALVDYNLRCMDEGTPGGIHLAGEGILYPQAAKDLKGIVKGIYSHEGCGAAKVYVDQNHILTDNPDQVGDEKAKELAGELSVPYLGSIPASRMDRPKSLHTARVVYYAGQEFDPSKIGLPSGFQVDRWIISDCRYAQYEANLATGIALGNHGFGSFFTHQTPFYLVGVGNGQSKVALDILTAELREIAGNRKNVVVDVIQI